MVDLLELPSLGIALQSVWKEAAESGVKPGMAEYRNHAWEDRQHTRTVDRGDEGRLAAVYVVESRDPSAGKYRSDVLVPLETMAADVRLKPMVTPMLERASSRSRTCATTGRSLRTGHRIPSNKVTSLYLIGASHPLKAGMPFYGVSNFRFAWPLRFTIPLGGDIDLLECGWRSHLQGCPVQPFCNGSPAVLLRSKVLDRLLQLQQESPHNAMDTPAPTLLEQLGIRCGKGESGGGNSGDGGGGIGCVDGLERASDSGGAEDQQDNAPDDCVDGGDGGCDGSDGGDGGDEQAVTRHGASDSEAEVMEVSTVDLIRYIGFAVIDHDKSTAASMRRLNATIGRMRVQNTKARDLSNTDLCFVPVFQRRPTQFRDPHTGDGKRGTCEGIPHATQRTWCQQAQSVSMAVTNSIDLASALGQSLIVLENSILKTEEDSEMQAGHFDLKVSGLPVAGSIPPSLIQVTPLDLDTSLRVLPLGIFEPHHTPTQSEFDSHAIEVPIRQGQTFLMRYDLAHSGTRQPGVRLHSVIGPSDLKGHHLGNTFILPLHDGADGGCDGGNCGDGGGDGGNEQAVLTAGGDGGDDGSEKHGHAWRIGRARHRKEIILFTQQAWTKSNIVYNSALH